MTFSQKFGRNYKLTIQPIDGGESLVFSLPLTVRFDCQRYAWGGVNTLSLDIYNLSDVHRQRIYQDKNVLGAYFTEGGTTPDSFYNVTLEAGYGDQLHKIFNGRMLWADSFRQHTEIVTHIEASGMLFDLVNTDVNLTLNASPSQPITAKTILTTLITQFTDLRIGAIGDFPQSFTRPVALVGPAWSLILKYSGADKGLGNAYIDGNAVYVINNQEVTGGVLVIDDSTGILDTPRRQYNLLTVTTLLETGMLVNGQQIQIKSNVMPIYNGVYKILGVRHSGMISAAICGKMVTEFTLQAPGLYGTATQPGQGFTVVPNATPVAA